MSDDGCGAGFSDSLERLFRFANLLTVPVVYRYPLPMLHACESYKNNPRNYTNEHECFSAISCDFVDRGLLSLEEQNITKLQPAPLPFFDAR